MNIKSSQRRAGGSFMLLLTAFMWGMAFVAQSRGAEYIGAFTFNLSRFVIGAITLIPCVFLLDRLRHNGRRLAYIEGGRPKVGLLRSEWLGGALCGLVLCAASVLQQLGIEMIGSGKAGFLTSIYVVLVPVLGLFLGKRVHLPIWGGVALALVGVYLISVPSGEGFSIGMGEIYVILSSLVFAVHIMVIDHLPSECDGVRVSMVQFATAAVLALPWVLFLEGPAMSDILSAALPILYAGVMSCGGAYTLQILGQRNADPAVASLILSLESVFSVIGGTLILGERLSPREYIGCGVVFAAVIMTNLVEGWRARKQEAKDGGQDMTE